MPYNFLNAEKTLALRSEDNASVPWNPSGNQPLDAKGDAGRRWQDEGAPTPAPWVAPPPNPRDARDATFEADATRIEWVAQLQTATPDQIDTFVRGKVNADAVTNLATATACLKRIENGMVIIMKLLAISVRQ